MTTNRFSPRGCPVVLSVILLAVVVSVVWGFPSNWIEWSQFDSIAICRITMLRNDTVSIPADLLQQVKQGQIWRLLTPAVIHLGFVHLAVNIFLVYFLTAPVETEIGSWRAFAILLLIVSFSNLIQAFYSDLPFGGLSMIWCGILGYRALYRWFDPSSPLALRSWLVWLGLIGIGVGLLSGLDYFADRRPHWLPRIANAAHVTGLVVGALLAAISINLRRSRPGSTKCETAG